MSRDSLQRLQDIQAACEKIIRHTTGLSRDEAFADQLRFDGLLLNLHTIGEAVKNLPEDLRRRHSHVPWRRIAGMRDFISHVYFAIDLDIVWDTVTRDIPELPGWIRTIVEIERQPEEGPRQS